MEGEDIVDQYSDLNIFPPDYWAVLPSYSELNGELIDFGIQRNKPWIIQLAEQSSRKQAIDELKTLTTMVDYLYISQKKNQDGGFMYRTRVGFFETRNDAKKMLAKIQKENLEQFLPAKILELRHVMESALGQATGESSLNKLR